MYVSLWIRPFSVRKPVIGFRAQASLVWSHLNELFLQIPSFQVRSHSQIIGGHFEGILLNPLQPTISDFQAKIFSKWITALLSLLFFILNMVLTYFIKQSYNLTGTMLLHVYAELLATLGQDSKVLVSIPSQGHSSISVTSGHKL